MVSYKLTGVSGLLSASTITEVMETVNTPETSVNLYETSRCNISEDSHYMLTAMRT
jgi:hypothetical protein